MSGLLVDSGYNPIKPNYMKPDTDDDGFDDNVEVDVELTNVEVPGKQGNPSTSNMCYESPRPTTHHPTQPTPNRVN